MIGKCISHYRILEKLDVGGMGVVWKAEDVLLGRPVALKFLPAALSDDEEAKSRLIREAKAASALDHPNICTIYEIGETEEGQLFIAMAFYEGETLHRKISRGPLSVGEAVSYVRQIAAGLARSHELDIIHRDVKPANVFVTADGQVKILDFGLAKILGEGVTLTGLAQGTPAYMAPERIRNEKASPRTDLWSLGVLLHESLAGRRPFNGANVAEIIQSVHRDEPEDLRSLRQEVSPRLAAVVKKLLRKNPKARYRSCGELLADLDKVARPAVGTEAVPSIADSLRPAGFKTKFWALRWFVLPLFLVLVTTALFNLERADPEDGAARPERPTLAIVPFDVPVDEPGFPNREATEVTERLTAVISHSRRIHLQNSVKTRRIVRDMGGAAELYGSPAAVREFARRAEADQVLLGTVRRKGGGLSIRIWLRDGKKGKVLASVSADVFDEEDFLSEVDDLSFDIQQQIELPRQSAPRDPDLDRSRVTWPSDQAWQRFSGAMKLHHEYDEPNAAVLFEKALESDPDFPMAWAKLATVQRNMNDPDWVASAAKALEGADQLPPLERRYIEGLYASRDLGTWAEALEIFREAVDDAPDHYSARQNLAVMYQVLERYEDSIAQGEVLLREEAPFKGIPLTLAESYTALGELENAEQVLLAADPGDFVVRCALGRLRLRQGLYGEALASFAAAESIRPAHPVPLEGRCNTYLLEERWQEALALAADSERGPENPELGAVAARCAILAELYRGRSSEALERAARAVTETPAAPLRASLHLARTRIHLLRAEAEQALGEAQLARQEYGGHPLEIWALFYASKAEIERRDLEAAGRLAEELVRLAEPPSRQAERLHRHLRGLLALAEGRAGEAVAELRGAAALLPVRAIRTSHYWPDHVPLWFSLAQASIAAGDRRHAIESLEKIVGATEERLDHPGLYVRSLLLLGRLYHDEGDETSAREYLERFINLWRDGDLDREQLSALGI